MEPEGFATRATYADYAPVFLPLGGGLVRNAAAPKTDPKPSHIGDDVRIRPGWRPFRFRIVASSRSPVQNAVERTRISPG
jgi:hypothetical protein